MGGPFRPRTRPLGAGGRLWGALPHRGSTWAQRPCTGNHCYGAGGLKPGNRQTFFAGVFANNEALPLKLRIEKVYPGLGLMAIHKAWLSIGTMRTQPATAGAGADASDSDSDSTLSPEPGVLGSEPENTEEDMSGEEWQHWMKRSTDYFKRCRRRRRYLRSHLLLVVKGTRGTMATVLSVAQVLEQDRMLLLLSHF